MAEADKWTAVALRLDEEDSALLIRGCMLEKLNQSDVIRRAIREYVRQLESAKEAS
jgi:hypothetical protein